MFSLSPFPKQERQLTQADLLGRKRVTHGDDEVDNEDEDGDIEEESEEDMVILSPFTQLSIHQSSTKFTGPECADHFARNVSWLSDVPVIAGGDGGLDPTPHFCDDGALPSRRSLVRGPDQVRLPPPDVARRLFAAQYTYIGTIFAFADPAGFERELGAAYRGPPNLADRRACLAYAKVLVILAFGKLYSVNQWIDYRGPPGFEYFSQALQLLPDAHEEGSILCVETLALVGYFMQNMNRHDAAFLYIGTALRMAISLGLHHEVSDGSREPCADPDRDESRERRRRVWWSVYSLDRIVTVKSGSPVTIHDEDIGVRLPSCLPGEPAYCPAVVLRHYTELSRILGDITTTIYRRARGASESGSSSSGRRLKAAVEAVIAALERWHCALPDELRFDPARLGRSRESVSTFCHYHQCVNMTARPLLFHVVRKQRRAAVGGNDNDWRRGLGAETVRIIDMCVGAARDTVAMMAEARAHNLLATYGYMDGEHVFSAAIVLVVACAALPGAGADADAANVAARDTGLDLLRGMAERGWNSHMAARYELLAHLRSVFAADGSSLSPPTVSSIPAVFPERHQPMSPSSSPSPPPWSSFYAQSSISLGLAAAQVAPLPNSLDVSTPLVMMRTAGASPSPVISHPRGYTAEVSPAWQNLGESPFTVLDHRTSLGEPGSSGQTTAGGDVGADFMLWEDSFANPAVDAGHELTYWQWPTPDA